MHWENTHTGEEKEDRSTVELFLLFGNVSIQNKQTKTASLHQQGLGWQVTDFAMERTNNT